jgi:hypothetical protein
MAQSGMQRDTAAEPADKAPPATGSLAAVARRAVSALNAIAAVNVPATKSHFDVVQDTEGGRLRKKLMQANQLATIRPAPAIGSDCRVHVPGLAIFRSVVAAHAGAPSTDAVGRAHVVNSVKDGIMRVYVTSTKSDLPRQLRIYLATTPHGARGSAISPGQPLELGAVAQSMDLPVPEAAYGCGAGWMLDSLQLGGEVGDDTLSDGGSCTDDECKLPPGEYSLSAPRLRCRITSGPSSGALVGQCLLGPGAITQSVPLTVPWDAAASDAGARFEWHVDVLHTPRDVDVVRSTVLSRIVPPPTERLENPADDEHGGDEGTGDEGAGIASQKVHTASYVNLWRVPVAVWWFKLPEPCAP